MNALTRRELLAAGLAAGADAYAYRDYHNVVLTTGVVPLDILAREVDRYVKARSA